MSEIDGHFPQNTCSLPQFAVVGTRQNEFMSQFNSQLEARLRGLSTDQSTDDFLREQNEICNFARACYEDLVDIVYDHTDKFVRENGMWIIRFLHLPGHQTVLNDIRLADPDPDMQSLAKTILFGSLVDESIRDAAVHPGGVEGYLTERRGQSGSKESASDSC